MGIPGQAWARWISAYFLSLKHQIELIFHIDDHGRHGEKYMISLNTPTGITIVTIILLQLIIKVIYVQPLTMHNNYFTWHLSTYGYKSTTHQCA